MKIAFNAGEVFEIAQQVERNGQRFYRRAAEQLKKDVGLQSMLLDLAAMEEEHERTFADMAAELSPQERQDAAYDPDNQAVQYLRAVAGGYVFDLRGDPLDWLGEGRSVEQILRKAIAMEKDSIAFYLGIKEAMPGRLGRGRIDGIIREEMSHVSLLSERLASLGG